MEVSKLASVFGVVLLLYSQRKGLGAHDTVGWMLRATGADRQSPMIKEETLPTEQRSCWGGCCICESCCILYKGVQLVLS